MEKAANKDPLFRTQVLKFNTSYPPFTLCSFLRKLLACLRPRNNVVQSDLECEQQHLPRLPESAPRPPVLFWHCLGVVNLEKKEGTGRIVAWFQIIFRRLFRTAPEYYVFEILAGQGHFWTPQCGHESAQRHEKSLVPMCPTRNQLHSCCALLSIRLHLPTAFASTRPPSPTGSWGGGPSGSCSHSGRVGQMMGMQTEREREREKLK